jgi:hypothetical protein
MSRKYSKILITVVSLALFFLCTSFNLFAEEAKAAKVQEVDKVETADNTDKAEVADKLDKSEKMEKDGLMERIDFGNSYILGQSIKSGAVYLLHRKKSNIKSMLQTRDDYRKEILEDLKVSEKK